MHAGQEFYSVQLKGRDRGSADGDIDGAPSLTPVWSSVGGLRGGPPRPPYMALARLAIAATTAP
jgi:hypothetical protein